MVFSWLQNKLPTPLITFWGLCDLLQIIQLYSPFPVLQSGRITGQSLRAACNTLVTHSSVPSLVLDYMTLYETFSKPT